MHGNFQYPFDFAVHTELTFGNFVAGEAHAPLLHFLTQFHRGGERLCYLRGAAGSGKTHLLQALCQMQALCQNGADAVYLPLRQLLPFGPATLDGLESIGLLAVDDLEAIAGKREWELRFFELFNAVHAGTSRLCMAATQGPQHLPLELADLRSRLQLCVQFEVPALDDSGKAALLQQLAQQRGMEIKDEVAQFILLRSARGMQELLEVIELLDKLSLAEQRRITIPFVKASFGW